MSAHLPRRETHPRTAARQAAVRLRRLAAALAALTCGLLASAAIVPAASAHDPDPGPGGAYGPGRAGRPRDHRRRHGGLADHLDRAGRRPGRGRPSGAAGPGAGRPPGRLRTTA